MTMPVLTMVFVFWGADVRLAGLPLLLPELLPIIQAFQDLALETALGRTVEFLTSHAVGKIVLAREALVGVVVVLVALAVADVLHKPRRRIEDVHRRRQRPMLLRCAFGAIEY